MKSLRHVTFLWLIAFLLGVPEAAAVEISTPEKFWRGIPQPDGTIQLVYTCPSTFDNVEEEDAWWNACAKVSLLIEENQEFRAAYNAARSDPDLQKIGVSYAAWSRASQEEKLALRERIHQVVQRVVARQRLSEFLASMSVDETKLSEQRTRNEARLAARLGISQPDIPLIEYCPGAPGNVRINSRHPSFAQFQRAIEDPETLEQYRRAASAFAKYLDENPQSSRDERNAELLCLLSPILEKVFSGAVAVPACRSGPGAGRDRGSGP